MKKLIAALTGTLAIIAIAIATLAAPSRAAADAQPICKYVNASLQCTADCDEGPECPCVVGGCEAEQSASAK